ncbi:MAG: hypothetical protein EGQ63_05705 [Clostridiales bacterium]|nr:hypothetical protein [Clostridiales bacterium]
MRYIRVSEQPFVLVANCILLLGQFGVLIYANNDVAAYGVICGICLILISPLLWFSYKERYRNNYLYEHGVVIKARICLDQTRVIFALSTMQILKFTCTYFDNGTVYAFKDEIMIPMYEKGYMMQCIENADGVDVVVDADYTNYKILFDKLFPNQYSNLYLRCPAICNYIVVGANVIVFIVTALRCLRV